MRRKGSVLILILLCVTLVSSGCYLSGMETDSGTTVKDDLWVREEIVFGTNIQDSAVVTDQDWQQFLGEVVTPKFPDGFSVLSGYGQYLMHDGTIVKERSWTLVIYLPALRLEKERAIADIISAYKQRFRQESVLRSTSPARVRFE